MKNNIKVFSIAIVAVLIVGAGLFLTREEKPKQDAIAIRIFDDSQTVRDWEIIKKLTGEDILEEEGVKLELISSFQSTGGTDTMQATLANNIDYASGFTTIWINANAAGGKVKAVLGSARTSAEDPNSFWTVLNDSKIYSIEDLKGKKLAVNVLGARSEYIIKGFLKQKGMSIDQVELIVVPNSQQEQMLRSKQVDAADLGKKQYLAAKKKGGIRVIVTDYDMLKKDYVKSYGGFREDFLKEHPDTVRRFVTAYEKSGRLVWEEYQKDPQKIKKIASEIVTEKGGNPEVQDYTPTWSPSAPFITDENVQLWIDLFVDDGILKPGQLKPSDVYTNEFNSYYKK